MKSFIKLMKATSDLSTVTRYSQSVMSNRESVLEHSASVAIFALYFYEGLRNNPVLYHPFENREEIDLGKLLAKAIVHDFDEIATGDVARPVKYYSEEMRSLFKDLETENMRKISSDIFGTNNNCFLKYWESAKDDSIEGLIVSLCDTISVVYKLYDEIVIRNNLSMTRYFSYDTFENALSEKITKIKNHFDDPVKIIFLSDFYTEIKFLFDDIHRKIESNFF